MRLKFLFFPIIIIISLSIFIGYIWPEIANLRVANEEKIQHNKDLEAIRVKQAAIKKIGDQINGDSEGEAVINSYLPSSKVEERILTGINYLATDSGVSLVNISLSGDGSKSTNNSEDAALVAAASPLSAAITSGGTAGAIGADKSKTKSDVKTTQASISVSGDYDKIRLFLDQVQKMSLLNSVKSITITSQPASEKAASTSTEGATEAAPSNSLSLDMVVDFGWMSPVQIDSQKVANFKSGLDNTTIAVVKKYVSQKTPTVDRFGDRDGKRNPFLP